MGTDNLHHRSGWLEEPELARLGVLLNRPIVIRSSLPAVEDDTFPEWVLMPGLFTADIIRRVQVIAIPGIG